MASRVPSDNPRAQNQQMGKESKIRMDGLIDDSAIRFPFLKTEQGLLQFPENQLFCCDSRLAVLVADPEVKVTVLRRWDVDERCTNTTGQEQETCATRSTERSSKTVINTTTKSTQSGERKPEESGERRAQDGDKFTFTTKKTIDLKSTPKLSAAQSESYTTTTKENRTGNGSESKTAEQVETRSYCEEPEDSSGMSMSFRSSYDKNIQSSKPTGSLGKTASSTATRGTPYTAKPKGPVGTTEESSYYRTTRTIEPTGPSGTTTSSTSQRWAPDTSNLAGPSRMTTEETSESLDISNLKPTRPSFMTTSTISPCWNPPDTPKPVGPTRLTTEKTSESWTTEMSLPIGPSRITTLDTSQSWAPPDMFTSRPGGPTRRTTEETSESWATSTPKTVGPSTMTTEGTSESWSASTAKPMGPSGMTTSNVPQSWTSEMSLPIGPSRLTTIGPSGTTTSKTSEHFITEISRPVGPTGTTTSMQMGDSRLTTMDTSLSLATLDMRTSKPGGPTKRTTEETSESWATSTPKPMGPSGATTSKTSEHFVTEISRPVGPTGKTTSKPSQSWSSAEKTTTKKTTHEHIIPGEAASIVVDNEESLEKALENFVVYSRSANFMTTCADDVLAMLEDDRIKLRSERDAFRAANEWFLNDPVNREQHATKVMSGVRFSLMSLLELLRVVHASRYLVFNIPDYRDQLLEAFIWRVACHCGCREHFLDFEPTSRGKPCGHECPCQCHVPNSTQGVTCAEGC